MTLVKTYEFDQLTLDGNGWREIPGGYTGAQPGATEIGVPVKYKIPASADDKGIMITVDPNEVTFLFAGEPIQTNGHPTLLRMTVRANGDNAAIALAALKGNLLTQENLDKSIATNIPATATRFMNQSGVMYLLFQPDADGMMTPLIQVASVSASNSVTVWVDRLEVLLMDKEIIINDGVTTTPGPITINIPGLSSSVKQLEMEYIPAGTFMMGSPVSEQDRDSEEGPQHQVTITKPFYMGKYEVTQAQWQAVMGSNPASSYGVGSNYPVYYVSWNDCQTFIQK